MTKWYENDEKVLSFLNFMVETGLISNQRELAHFANNIEDYDDAYKIWAKEIEGDESVEEFLVIVSSTKNE